jgi:hypothetical protein
MSVNSSFIAPSFPCSALPINGGSAFGSTHGLQPAEAAPAAADCKSMAERTVTPETAQMDAACSKSDDLPPATPGMPESPMTTAAATSSTTTQDGASKTQARIERGQQIAAQFIRIAKKK